MSTNPFSRSRDVMFTSLPNDGSSSRVNSSADLPLDNSRRLADSSPPTGIPKTVDIKTFHGGLIQFTIIMLTVHLTYHNHSLDRLIDTFPGNSKKKQLSANYSILILLIDLQTRPPKGHQRSVATTVGTASLVGRRQQIYRNSYTARRAQRAREMR